MFVRSENISSLKAGGEQVVVGDHATDVLESVYRKRMGRGIFADRSERLTVRRTIEVG